MLPLLLTLVALFEASNAQITTATKNFFEPRVVCTLGGTECTTPFSICALTATPDVYNCACDEPNGYNNDAGTCKKASGLGELCSATNSICPGNSACKDAGDNTAQSRCKCNTGYVSVNDDPADLNSPLICGLLQTTSGNPACTACEANMGVCFKKTAADAGILCQCPSYKNGTNCENSFVEVTCDLKLLTMTVCYTIQDQFNFSDTATMYASGFGNDPQCLGAIGAPTGCDQTTQVGLVLSLNETDMARCGTQLKAASITSKRYQTTILVTKASDSQPPIDMISFQAFCSYQEYSDQQFSPVGLGSANGNDQGQHIEPILSLSVLDSFLNKIREGVAVKVGDTIFFEINLDTSSNTYMGFRVESCTLSNKPNLYAKDAFTRTLITDSCPAPGQSVFTDGNVFNMVNYSPANMRTGQVTVFSVPVDGSIFIHCKLKLCLQNVTECAVVDCANKAAETGKRRRKRDVTITDDSASISRELIIEDPNRAGAVVMSSTTFAIMIGVLCLILLLFIIVSILLFLRLRRSQPTTDKVGDTVFMTQKPQRFAMPRVDRSQVRM